MKCHMTGFEHPGGYNDSIANICAVEAGPMVPPTAEAIAKHNAELRGVGCESCHGPASEHVKNHEGHGRFGKLINPYRPTPAERVLEDNRQEPEERPRCRNGWDCPALVRRRIEANTCA